MKFRVVATSGVGRAGELDTPHGSVPTPAFMPVATQGSVKALTPEDVEAIGARVILANAYHLYLRPGVDIVGKLGGLHSFTGWKGPILTDSGGFQAFSLGSLRKISDAGILFRSHIDGSEHHFTPEAATLYQERLGADIIMCLDQCIAYGESRESVRPGYGTDPPVGGQVQGGPQRRWGAWRARPSSASSREACSRS